MLRIFVMHDTFLTDLEVRAVKDGLSEFLRYNPRRAIRFLGSTPVRKNGEYFSADSFLIQSRHFSSLDFRRARKYDGNKILEAMDREAPYTKERFLQFFVTSMDLSFPTERSGHCSDSGRNTVFSVAEFRTLPDERDRYNSIKSVLRKRLEALQK